MKKSKWLLLLLAIALILSTAAGSAFAYFSTYTTAKGGYVLGIGGDTTIHEDPAPGKKLITISNSEEAHAVFVRVKAISGEQYMDGLTYSGADWSGPDADGFWRYEKVLEGGESSTELVVEIKELPSDPSDGDSFNVVVVYESVPAVFLPNGEPDLDTAWTIGNS